MSAKYICDVCGRKLSRAEKCNELSVHKFIDHYVRVQFIVDFNQWEEKDICKSCALQSIIEAAKKLKREEL